LLLIIGTMVTAAANNLPKDSRLLSYDTIFPVLQHAFYRNPGLATAIGLLLFVGACGKSAQFPLYLWLPDAMAGPTPVSALIHAATMVTSGVVLLSRMHMVYEFSAVASVVICMVGAFTALFAAVIAFGQTDIKKVLAYSTVSQLGFMFVACGSGAYWVGIFHVTTHAFFKALLFLGSGAVIHSMSHEQDMRNYGKLAKYIPITFVTMMCGYLAISGVPLLSGAVSKEKIISTALTNDSAKLPNFDGGQVAGWICLLTALLTAMYMTRMMWLTFFGNKEQWRDIPVSEHHLGEPGGEDHHVLTAGHRPHEVPISMWFPLVILAALSLGGGWYLNQNDRLQNWLSASTVGSWGNALAGKESGVPVETISMAAAFSGIFLGILFYWKGLPKREGWNESNWSPVRLWVRNQFGFDKAMVSATVDGGSEIATLLERNVDDALIGGTGVGMGWLSDLIGGLLIKLQSGLVRLYALGMLAGVVGLVVMIVVIIHGGHR
jgi:NADH-quinone oxidoreductase subunit L